MDELSSEEAALGASYLFCVVSHSTSMNVRLTQMIALSLSLQNSSGEQSALEADEDSDLSEQQNDI